MEIDIRAATEDDIPGILEVIADRIGDEDAAEAEIVLQDPKFDRNRWFVAASDEEVLSTAAIFPGQLRVGEVSVGAGAIEFVATRETAEGKGLVKRLMERIHDTASDRGEMLQWIVGITYFYRRFGYEYAIPVEGMHMIGIGEAPPMPKGWSVRDADESEIRAVAGAQLATGRSADVALSGTQWMWDVYRRSPNYEVVIAKGPKGQGVGRIYAYEDDRYLMDVIANSHNAAAALTNAASEDGTRDLSVMSREAPRPYLESLAPVVESGDAYYLRVAEPVELLEALRPVLAKRLAAHEGDPLEGDALISLYGSSIRFTYGAGKIGPMRREGPVAGPISAGGSGVAPDLIVSLILGPLGAAGLAALHPDVNLGEQDELMKTLFPVQTCDVHSWVVP